MVVTLGGPGDQRFFIPDRLDRLGQRCAGEELFGTGLVMLGQYSEESWMGGHPPDALAGTISVYLAIDDPDAHHDRATPRELSHP